MTQPAPRRYDRMSAHDVGYLRRETATQPLHYVLQLDLDGHVDLATVRATVADRLPLLPLAYRRLRYPLLAGRPVWVDDRAFDVSRHVDEVVTQDADALLAALALELLPRDRPLWHLTVAQTPERTLLLLRVHHAMMDGQLVRAFVDALLGPVAPSTPHRLRRGPSRVTLAALVVARRVARVAPRRRQGTAPAATPAAASRPTRLTGEVSGTRSVASTSVSLTDAKQRAKLLGCTLNDLYLAVAAQALSRYLTDPPADVVALVPRNVRTDSEVVRIGNKAWSILVTLPLGDLSAEERLAVISPQTRSGKQTAVTDGTQGWRFDVALSNVAFGADHRVGGRQVVGTRTGVPLQGTNRLVGVLTTHGDALTVSWTADGAAFGDVQRLADLTREGWGAVVSA